jgi:hypothetical protein
MVRRLVEEAYKTDTRLGNPFVAYRVVDFEEATRLRESAGIEAEGYTHIVDASAVRHILRQYRREPRTGQLSVSNDDIARVPEIVAKPDTIESAGKNKRGMEGIRYRKRVNDYIFIVEEMRVGRKHLAASTMFKYPAGATDS